MTGDSMKSALLVESRYRSEGRQLLQRRRVSKVTSIQNNDFDHDLAMAIEESLKYARQNSSELKENEEPDKLLTKNVTLDNSDSRILVEEKTVDANVDRELKQMKDLLLVHVDLIHHQNELLATKDKEIARLKADNESLKCRLERMTRRMSLVRQKDDLSVPTLNSDGRVHEKSLKRKLGQDDHIRLSSQNRNSAAAVRRFKHDSRQITFLQRRRKRMRHIEQQRKIRKPNQLRRDVDQKEPMMKTDSAYFVAECESLAQETENLDNPDTPQLPHSQIRVQCPSWRIKPVSNLWQLEGTENLEDEIFLKRHQKLEQDEKRRKRWDLQRIREDKILQRLREKERDRNDKHGRHSPVLSFYSALDNITHIHVVNKIPVTAFGRPVPSIKSSDFELPWKPVKSSSGSRTPTVDRSKNK